MAITFNQHLIKCVHFNLTVFYLGDSTIFFRSLIFAWKPQASCLSACMPTEPGKPWVLVPGCASASFPSAELLLAPPTCSHSLAQAPAQVHTGILTPASAGGNHARHRRCTSTHSTQTEHLPGPTPIPAAGIQPSVRLTTTGCSCRLRGM